jgi:hypothetical protein
VSEEAETLDSWMTDLSTWNSSSFAMLEVDAEEELELEKWMLNPDSEFWCSDQEEELKIEDWMTKIDKNYWDTEEIEEDQTLEVWMLTPANWLEE